MKFEEARRALEDIRKDLRAEKHAWQTLLETVLDKVTSGEERVEWAYAEQQKNAERAQMILERLDELRTVATETDAVTIQIVQPIQLWLAQINHKVQDLKAGLATLLPVFTMPTDEITDAVDDLKSQLETKAEALAETVGDRLVDAREQIEANLKEAVSLIEIAVQDLSEDVDDCIKGAVDALGQLWEESSESIVAAKDAVVTTGESVEEILAEATADAISKVTGNLGSLTDSIDELLNTLQYTMSTLDRTLALVGEATEGTAVGMSGASSALGVVRDIMASVA